MPVLPKPEEVLGTSNKLPSPDEVFSQKSNELNYSFFDTQQQPQSTDEIINAIEDVSDNEKEMLRNLTKKGADTETISNSIQVLQGTHPLQYGHKGYYVKDGIPQPLPKGFKPKDEKLAESVFSEKNIVEEVQSSFERGAMKLADGLLRAPEFLFDVAAEENWNRTMRVAGRNDLQITSKKLGEQTGVHNEPAIALEQAIEKRNKDFQNVYDKGITDYISEGEYSKAAGLLANSISESAPTTIALALTGGGTAMVLGGGAVFGAEKMQELEKEAPNMAQDKKLGIAATNGILEGFFEIWGITKLGRIAKEIIKKEGKDAAKEFIEDAFKQTYKPVMGKYFGIVGEEALGEGATQFTQNALDKYTGYRPDINLSDGVVDAMIVGVGAAAGPSVITANVEKNAAIAANERSKYIYNTVQKGPEAITALKAEVDNAVSRGALTPEEGEKAKFQADVYNEYNSQIGDLKIGEEEKREIYDLSYQKQGLQTEVNEDVVEKDLSPIELAKRNGKQQQIKDLQKQIDELVKKGQIKDEPVVAAKTTEGVRKEAEKKNEQATDIINRWGGLKAEEGEADFEEEKPKKSERRSKLPKFDAVDEQGVFEFNKQKPLEKKEILHDYFDANPELNNEIEGNIVGGQNNVWQVDLGGGRHIQFARSIKPDKFTGDYTNFPLGREKVKDADGREYERYTQPVGVKLESIKSDSGGRKRVLSIYNKQTGKHIVFAKEKEKGTSNYSEKEIEQLKTIQNKNYLTGEVEPNAVFTEQPPTEELPKETKQQFVDAGINQIKQEQGESYDPTLEKVYKEQLGKQFDEVKNREKEIVKTQKEQEKKDKDATKDYIKKIYSKPSATFEEAVVRFFLNKGKISSADFKRYMGFGETNERTGKTKGRKEFNQYIWALKNGATSIDNLVKELWTEDMERSEDNFDEQELINEFFEVLSQHGGKRSLLNRLLDIQREQEEAQDYASPEEMRYAEEQEAAERYVNERELTEDEIGEFLEQEQAREKVFAETGQFQKESKTKGDVDKVVKKLQSSMPKVKVVYNPDLNGAGKTLGNKVEVNPFRAGTDTPIHEYGHIFIDFLGYSNKVIQAAVKQLRGTDVWNDVHSDPDYSHLNEEMLAKETLARAIGVEGAGIFDKEADKSRFRTFLDYIFDWLKTKLGLNKNIAKSLAKQIIGGVGTKGMEGKNEQEQFAKKKYKDIEDFDGKDLIRKVTMSFEAYRESVLGESLSQIQKDLKTINNTLETGKYNGEEVDEDIIKQFKAIKAGLKKKEKKDLSKWMAYKEDVKNVLSFLEDKNIDELSEDQLLHTYSYISNNAQSAAKDAPLKRIMVKIAMNIFNKQKAALAKNPKFSEERAINQDLSDYREIKMKVLSHMTDAFPDLQSLSKTWDEAYFAKTKEAKELKRTHEKLGIDVINDTNKRLGIIDRVKLGVKGFFIPVGRNYFGFLNKNGKLIKLDEAKGLSDAQVKYLKFVRELLAERMDLVGNPDIYNMDMEVLKIDKSFSEAYSTEGIVQAFSNFLGNTYNISNVRISFTNPNTGKKEISEFKNIEKIFVDYGSKGNAADKSKAMASLAKYNSKARKQLKLGVNEDQKGEENKLNVIKGGDYTLDSEGKLVNKFDRPRSDTRGYSNDFYKAVSEYIDDSTHIKHISPLIPVINSIQYLNENGAIATTGSGEVTLHAKKPNVVKWMEEWKNLHVFKQQQQTTPELDVSLKFLRFLTSATTMLFNAPAAGMNLAIGLYNNFRAENASVLGNGLKRLFFNGNRKIKKDYAFGLVNPMVIDLVDKYGAVSVDVDSNPMMQAGAIFMKLGHALTRWGEMTIQSSMLAGQMTTEEYNSFEYKRNKFGVDELVVKEGVDEKALEKKMLSYINRVSDIQGKYSDKDKRNIMNNELGKAAFQFKVWMPDWWKERFGSEYIDRDGNVKKGSWSGLVKDGFKELRQDINDKGKVKGLYENKQFMSTLKGLMSVSLLMIMTYRDDEDKKKRSAAAALDKALADMLFIFDPNSLKFTVTKPFAAVGTIEKLINAADHMFAFEADDYNKRTGEAKIKKDVIGLIPGAKKAKQIKDFITDEE